MRIKIYTFVFLTLVSFRLEAKTSEIRVKAAVTYFEEYCIDLLKKVLNHKGAHYSVSEGANMNMARLYKSLTKGKLDVIWATTSTDLEKTMLPIRVPIFKGILGYRIFLIKKGNQEKFNKVRTLDHLKHFSIGQGRDWDDTRILKAHNFKVIESLNHRNLFYMLDHDRFDLYARGLHQAWIERDSMKDIELDIEKNLVIAYAMPMYFFVQKDNIELYEIINDNFHAMIKDGSFDNFFYNTKLMNDALSKAKLEQRKIFWLENKELPPLTPINNPIYWYQLPEVTNPH